MKKTLDSIFKDILDNKFDSLLPEFIYKSMSLGIDSFYNENKDKILPLLDKSFAYNRLVKIPNYEIETFEELSYLKYLNSKDQTKFYLEFKNIWFKVSTSKKIILLDLFKENISKQDYDLLLDLKNNTKIENENLNNLLHFELDKILLKSTFYSDYIFNISKKFIFYKKENNTFFIDFNLAFITLNSLGYYFSNTTESETLVYQLVEHFFIYIPIQYWELEWNTKMDGLFYSKPNTLNMNYAIRKAIVFQKDDAELFFYDDYRKQIKYHYLNYLPQSFIENKLKRVFEYLDDIDLSFLNLLDYQMSIDFSQFIIDLFIQDLKNTNITYTRINIYDRLFSYLDPLSYLYLNSKDINLNNSDKIILFDRCSKLLELKYNISII